MRTRYLMIAACIAGLVLISNQDRPTLDVDLFLECMENNRHEIERSPTLTVDKCERSARFY